MYILTKPVVVINAIILTVSNYLASSPSGTHFQVHGLGLLVRPDGTWELGVTLIWL